MLADGQSSRLYRSLVYDKQIAQSVGVRNHSAEIAGQFIVDVTAAAGHSLDEVEAAVDAEIARIWQDPPTDEELQRARNRLESSHYRQLARIGGFGGRADVLNYYNVFYGDPNMINTGLDKYLAVERDDIVRVGRLWTSRAGPTRQALAFYARMRIHGPGWARAARLTGIDPLPGGLLVNLVSCLASIALLYGLLLGTGHAFLGRWGPAAGCAAVAAVAVAVLARSLPRSLAQLRRPVASGGPPGAPQA